MDVSAYLRQDAYRLVRGLGPPCQLPVPAGASSPGHSACPGDVDNVELAQSRHSALATAAVGADRF